MSENLGVFDLFGEPVRTGHGTKGRPPFVVTDEKRNIVMLLLALHKSNEDIAAALGVTAPTLRKHFFSELKFRDEARLRVEAKLVSTLFEKASSGDVSAIDKMFKRLDKSDLAALSLKRGEGDAPKKKKLGKKEERQIAAEKVGGAFAPPPSPKRLN